LRFLFFIFFLFSYSVYSQLTNERLKEAETEFETGNYIIASELYAQLYSELPDNKELCYTYAESLRLSHQYSKALFFYKKCYSNAPADFPLAIFWSGKMQKILGQYNGALKEFRYFYKHFHDFTPFASFAKQEISSCKFALESLQDTIAVLKLSEYSSAFFEYFFLPLSDSSVAYSSFYENDTVRNYATLHTNGTNLLINALVNWQNKKRVSITAISVKNAKELYFSCTSDSLGNSRAYYGRLIKDKLEINNLSSEDVFSINHPCFCYFNSLPTIFFISIVNGNQNIYYSSVKNDSILGHCTMVESIASLGDEICPFYHLPSNTLYFSSNWHSGFGGFDVFYSKYNETGFSKALNAGYGINSSKNDLYFQIYDSLFYVTSNRDTSKLHTITYYDNDFYKGSVKDIPTLNKKNILHCSLYFANDVPQGDTLLPFTDYYEHYVDMRHDYLKQAIHEVRRKERNETKVEISAFFEEMKKEYELFEEMILSLNSYLESSDSYIEIILKGYASSSADEEYNKRLSEKRIESVKKEIITKCGKALERYPQKLSIKEFSFGEQESIHKDEFNTYSSDNMKDRRVDVLILYNE